MPFPDEDGDKKKKPAAPAPEASADDDAPEEGADGGGGDDLFDDEDVTGDEPELGTGGAHSTAPDAAPDQDVSNVIQQASAAIAELGLEVPPDTADALEFLKHVVTAAKTHKSTRDKVKSESAGPQTGQDAMGGDGTNEEQRPYLMSAMLITEKLKTVTDPEQKRMLLSLQALTAKAEKDRLANEKATAADCLAAIDRMVKRGLRPSHAQRFRAAIGQPSGYQLATGPKSAARQKRLRAIKYSLSIINDHLPGITDDLLRANAVEQPKPGQRGPDDDKRDVNHMIRLAGLTPLGK